MEGSVAGHRRPAASFYPSPEIVLDHRGIAGGTFNCSILGEFFARLVTNEGSVLIEVFNWVLTTSDHHVKAQLRPMRPSRLETFDLVSDSHPHMAFHADLV